MEAVSSVAFARNRDVDGEAGVRCPCVFQSETIKRCSPGGGSNSTKGPVMILIPMLSGPAVAVDLSRIDLEKVDWYKLAAGIDWQALIQMLWTTFGPQILASLLKKNNWGVAHGRAGIFMAVIQELQLCYAEMDVAAKVG